MKFESNQGLDDAALATLENHLGFRLPVDYRSFLRRTNGGSFVGGYPELDVDTVGTICCDTFFGMNMPRSLDLVFWYQEMNTEIPRNSLLIGKDPSGGLLLLCCDPGCSGVFYYDHSYVFPTSNDAENTYFITKDFGGLAKLVGIELT